MARRICVIVLACLLAVAATESENTKLTFFVEYEPQHEEDFMEIAMEIKAQDLSLVHTLTEAKDNLEAITNLAEGFCKEHASKKKNSCNETVDADNFSVEPKYQLIRKEPTFMAFIVTYEIKIKVMKTDQIGSLVDQILKKKGVKINGFEWKPLKEVEAEEKALKQGLEEGEGLCKQLKMKLGKIVSAEEVVEFGEEEKKDGKEDDDEDEEADEDQNIVYKFEVECEPKKVKKDKTQ